MKLSVIIPNLNSSVIRQTLEALEHQAASDAEVEVLVVGVDSPGQVRPSRLVRFIDTGSAVSASVARNVGIGHSSGEILCFLDADCLPCADWLCRIAAHFADDTLDVLGGGVDTAQTAYWPLCEHISSFHEYLVSAPAGTRDQLPTLNLSMRRTAESFIGRFNESIAPTEDSDFTTRLRVAGYVLHFDPTVVVEHRPSRHSFSQVFRHEWLHGLRSIKVDRRWWSVLKPPTVLRHRGLLLLAIPLVALFVTARIYLSDCSLRKWWYAAPGVFLLKLSWCWGAQEGLGARAPGAEVSTT